jgi:hypothetical protein
VIEGLPNNSRASAVTLDDSLSAFDLLGFPEIDRALFAAKSHFFYFGHVTFSFLGGCKYLNVAIRRHSSAPLAGLVTKSRARGAATHV